MAGVEPVAAIEPVAPSPSILTSARDAGADGGALAGVNWSTGVTWRSSCQPAYNELTCPDYGEGEQREDPDDAERVATDAFTIYLPRACSWSVGEAVNDEARALLEAASAAAVGRALWMGDGLPDSVTIDTGTAGVVKPPTLRRVAADATVNGPMDLDDAVAALLSRYVECTGGHGGATLHMPSVLIPAALGGGNGGATIARPEGNIYRGPLGSVVSPGPGYPAGDTDAGPNGAGPLTSAGPPEAYAGNTLDEVWVYVTGPVQYALGGISLLTDDEPRTNFHEVWAARPAIVRFDPCCVFAALVENPAGGVS